jgi:hypothetical protein
MRIHLAAVAAVAVSYAASSAMAGTIANWTFETSIPLTAGPHAAEVGSGAATGVHAGAATYSSPAGNGSAHSFSSNTWAIGDYYQFTASSIGVSDLAIAWDETRSSTGPASFEVQYTTNGSTYQALPIALVPAYVVPAINWSAGTPDATGTTSFTRILQTIPGLNNDATIGFRLVATSAPTSAAGTNRVDNFRILSDVPEPCSLLLVLCGMAGFGLARRR